MKFAAVTLLAACAATAAHAQYKCVDADGKTTFQQAACPATQRQQALKVNAAPPTPAAPPTTAAPVKSPDTLLLESLVRDRRSRELQQEIADIEATISNRNLWMSNEMAALSSRRTSGKNTLAGATYEQSLSTEMQAVATKYKTMNDVDFERLKVLRAELETIRKSVEK